MGWIMALLGALTMLIGIVVGWALGTYGVMLWSKNRPDDFDEALERWRSIWR